LDRRWRIGAVSYLNTRPLLLGLERSPLMEQMELIKDYPAAIAQQLLDGTIDMGLVPVAITPLLKEAHLVSQYCIGTEGEVASVAIFSEVPLEQVTHLYLDYQSKTSVRLAQILLKEYWKKEVVLCIAEEGYIQEIKGTVAGVIIGDRALKARSQFKYIYDLGSAWVSHTGLPFVFATWIANKPIPSSFMSAFDTANEFGIQHLDQVIAAIPPIQQVYDLKQYYSKNISYHLSVSKRKGMELFLSRL